MRHSNHILAIAFLLVAMTACGVDERATTTSEAPIPTTATTEVVPTTPPTDPTTATTEAPSATTTPPAAADGGAVYFLLEELDPSVPGPYLVPVFRPDDSDLVALMDELMAGPTSDELAGTPAISTAIPKGVDVLGVELADGMATVDLGGAFDDGGGSASMFARLAQVTFTLTRIEDVDGVVFLLDGEPVPTFSSEGIELGAEPQEREDYVDFLPPVFVDEPAWGQPVQSPVEVRGLSNVFEATSQLMLTDDDGLPLYEGFVTATCGTGCWGEWEATVPYEADRDQFGALIVWAESAEDGSRINIREYPIQLR